jgi:hypothetical protein
VALLKSPWRIPTAQCTLYANAVHSSKGWLWVETCKQASHLLRMCINGCVCARKGRMDTLLGLHLGAWHVGVFWQVLDMRGAIVYHSPPITSYLGK